MSCSIDGGMFGWSVAVNRLTVHSSAIVVSPALAEAALDGRVEALELGPLRRRAGVDVGDAAHAELAIPVLDARPDHELDDRGGLPLGQHPIADGPGAEPAVDPDPEPVRARARSRARSLGSRS